MEKCCLYIVLVRTNTIISRIIHFVKNDEYTHAAISLDKNLDNMYSFGRKYTYYPFIGRFRQEEIYKGLYKTQKRLPGVIMEVEVSEQQYRKAVSLLNRFISNRNSYKYNYRGLLYSLLNKPLCYDDRFLCSEYVYYILNESGIADFNRPRNLVSPQDLLKLKSRLLFKGDLKQFKPAV